MSQTPPNRASKFRSRKSLRLRLAGAVIVVVACLLVITEFPGLADRFSADRDNSAPLPPAVTDSSPVDTVKETRSDSDQLDREASRARHSISDAGPGAALAAVSDSDDRAAQPNERVSAGRGDADSDQRPELSISGAVLDDRGSLLPGVTVQALAVGPPGLQQGQSGGALTQVTDGLGGFVFTPIPEGEYRLSVEGTGEFRGVDKRVRAGVANAELRVQRVREIRVHGRIIDENGGALENVRVRDLGGSIAAPSNVDGAYEITVEPVKAGQAPVVEFKHPRYRSLRRRVSETVGSNVDEVRLDVEMQPIDEQVAVLGHLSGPDGEAVTDAEVWLSSADPRNYLSTQSNERGEFEFDRVERGDAYRLGVNPGADYRRYVSEAFAVGPGNTAHDVRLEAGGHGSLSGRLIDPDGRPLDGFAVWLRSQDSGGGHTPVPVASDATGNFEIEQVPAGMLRLESTSQPRLQAGGIELQPGQSRHVEVPLDWGERWMFGRVVDVNGTPVAGAQVTLQWSRRHHDVISSSRRRAASDVEGFFAFSNLGARDYSVTVRAQGFETLRRGYASGSEDLEIVLSPAGPAGGSR